MVNNLNQRLDRYAPAVLSVFRVIYGLLFAGLGSIGLFDWPIPATPRYIAAARGPLGVIAGDVRRPA